MLHALQQYLRSAAADGRRVREVGPFSLLIHPRTDHPYLNYAVPRPFATPTPDDVVALDAAFAEEERVPRLEFLPAVAPEVEVALVRAGFVPEARLRLLACTPGDLRVVPPVPGVLLQDVDPARDLDAAIALVRVQTAAFGEPAGDDEALRSTARTKTTPAVLARVGGEPAGGGQCLPILGGTTELVGIGVLERHRRRGVAAAVTARLVDRAFAAGAERAILTPGGEDTARVYARCGFATVGEMLHLRRG